MSEITPSQTVGPFFAYGLAPNGRCKWDPNGSYRWKETIGDNLVTAAVTGDRIRVEGQVIDGDGVRSVPIAWLKEVAPRLCIFEFAYIARPDSKLYGREVHETRCRMGELLAAQAPVAAAMKDPTRLA